MAIEIEADEPQGIPVRLVGKDYTARPPKAMSAMALAKIANSDSKDPEEIVKAIQGYLEMVFGKRTSNIIMKRLEDPNDLLDIRHITSLMQKLTEMVAGGNPTT